MTTPIPPIEDVDLDESMIVGLLRPYVEAREQEAIYGKQRVRLGDLIKHYLEQHDQADLVDGEHDLTAKLQHRSGAPAYDLLSIRAQDDVLFKRLLDLGCLKVDVAAVKAQQSQLNGISKYAMPGIGTVALLVEDKR